MTSRFKVSMLGFAAKRGAVFVGTELAVQNVPNIIYSEHDGALKWFDANNLQSKTG